MLKLRPQITREMCEEIVRNPRLKDETPSGRKVYWGWVAELKHYVRVVTLADGTFHTVMIDSKFSRRRK